MTLAKNTRLVDRNGQQRGGDRYRDKLTLKQEAACQAYLITDCKTAAYIAAGYSQSMKPETINRRAFDLFDNGKIQARVSELRDQLAKDNKVTMTELITNLRKAMEMSRSQSKGGELGENVMRLAKLCGLIVDKTQNVTGHADILAMIEDGD